MRRSKDPIRLRMREVANGNKSLYLDIYINGKRSYEYLKLYLVPEKSSSDKAKNRETMQLAEAIRARKVVELQNGRFGFETFGKQDVLLFDYFVRVAEDREAKGSTSSHRILMGCLEHLKRYCKPSTRLRDIDEQFCRGWSNYLAKAAPNRRVHTPEPLSPNTQNMYWLKFCTVLNQARRDGVLQRNPAENVTGPRGEESERVYLTIDELRAMEQTECRNIVLRRAFLFACLTGLRKSDVQALEWRDLARVGDYWRITFRQVKTGGLQYQDISDEARSYIGDKPLGADDEEKIFQGFSYTDYTNITLRKWAEVAGVHKHITFHSARHTFALLLLNQSTDIYTVSRLLGHSSLRMTERYAHILDKKKQEAIKSLPKIKL